MVVQRWISCSPKKIDAHIYSRVKSCMLNQFRFWHFQCCGHPVQKPNICWHICIDKLWENSSQVPWAASCPFEVPFWKVHSVINRLYPQNCKGKKEPQCRQYVYARRNTNVSEGTHIALTIFTREQPSTDTVVARWGSKNLHINNRLVKNSCC